MIADEVGTEKTIEAGLIWAELESRATHGLENVWIILPQIARWVSGKMKCSSASISGSNRLPLKVRVSARRSCHWSRDGVFAA